MVKCETKVTDAYWPRGPGSSIKTSDQLKIVYLKFSPEIPVPDGCTKVNFVFVHGTGMNKSLWKTHIEELYKRSEATQHWRVGNVISVDGVSHGDSALLNKGKISWGNDWRDGAKDLITVVKHEVSTTSDFLPSESTKNIVVGHSMGGFNATYACFLEPTLFDACVAIEPVVFLDEGAEPFMLERFRKVERVLKDEFSSKEEANTYFKKKTFFRVMDPKVSDDFINDEVYSEDGKFKTKSTNEAQIASYLTAAYSIRFGQNILKLLEVPYLYITGKDANWNSPNSDEYVESSVPEHLLERAQLKGDHLVHTLNVKGTVDEIFDFVSRRVEFVETNRDKSPDVRFKSKDVTSRIKAMLEHMWKGDVERTFLWDRPQKPKL